MTSTDPARVTHPAHADETTRAPRQLLQALNWGPAQLGPPALRWAVSVMTLAGAVLVLLSGLIHLKLWVNGGYQGISVIGPLFLAQAIVGILLAVALGLFRRLGLVLAGAGYCIATAAGLLISVNVGLFGFKDSLAVPYATSSMLEELAGGAVLLAAAALLAGAARRRAARPGRRDGERVWPPAS